MDFLEKTADFLFSSFGTRMDDVCVVLPNRRGGLFLKRHLAKKFNGPSWSPEIVAIEDFLCDLSGLAQIDVAEQLFIFYSVYKKNEAEKAESFEAFCKWAPTLLNDFSEADLCLADTEKLFGNLSDIRAIENWSLGQTELTDFQKQYLHFWSRIGLWYREYRDILFAAKKAYTGLIYRTVADRIAAPGTLRWKKIVFAGFNALSPSEEKIITTLKESGRAETLWDADHYYLDDAAQEAGRYLRKRRNEFFTAPVRFRHVEDLLAKEEKKVIVTGVARHVSQAKAAAHFLQVLEKEKRYSPSTVIVVADETSLLPLLHALPAEAAAVNITMGFPLRNTPVATLSNILFRLHENAQRFNIHTREGELKYYHHDLLALLRHPYIRRLLAGSGLTEKLEIEITRLNVVFASTGQLARFATEKTIDAQKEKLENAFGLFRQFLKPWTDPLTALHELENAILLLRGAFTNVPGEFNIETEYIFQLNLIVKRARTLHEQWNITTDLKALRALVIQQLASTSLPFYGEPVAGLQIMGLLETRTLDFENVIFLGANENILPGSRSQSTFIIYELRKAFGLPVWNDRDAVSAYNFYRLLQRAKNIFLVYNTDQEIFGSREKSRFVTQLLHELPEKNKRASIVETVFDAGIPLAADPPQPIRIPKDATVLQRMDELATSGLSPSLLNSYRACGLQFYFHYIAGLREPEEVEETIGADTLGTIIHGALEELFRPLIGKPLTAEALEQAKKSVQHLCDAMFAKHYSVEESSYGKNLLAKKIAARYIQNYLDLEKKQVKQVPAIVDQVETELSHSMLIGEKNVRIYGKADRIDKTSTWIRLIDYKTGKTAKNELEVKDWNEILAKPSIGKSFQLLTYAWLYSRMTNNRLPIQSGIISFRKLSDGLLNVVTPEGGYLMPEALETFEGALVQLLEELFDTHREFVQTENEEVCRICTFNAVCRRD